MRPIPHLVQDVSGIRIEGKSCSRCKAWKPLGDYGKLGAASDGLQRYCKPCMCELGRKYNAVNIEKRRELSRRGNKRLGPAYFRERHQLLKRAMVMAYGGECECCGETEIEFLTLDHINGGGHQHRKAVGGGSKVWRMLRDAGWPKEGYRLLCMNCQLGFAHGRTCPHQLKKE